MGYSSLIKSRLALDLWTMGIIYGAIAVLFHDLPEGFWHGDDTAILIHTLDSHGLTAFYQPEVWRKLSPSNLTPWLSFSFKTDLWLAGLDPRTFYLHQLFSLGILTTGAYLLGRVWMPVPWTLFFILLFLAGAPTDSVVSALMTRHYLEGLLFATLSAIGFILAERQKKATWLIFSSIFYALAVTAKEVYVPLPIVLFLIPSPCSARKRLVSIAPLGLIAIIYIIWRKYMLGDLIGGYSPTDSGPILKNIADAITTLSEFPAFLFGPHWLLPSITLACTTFFILVKNPKAIPVSLALLLSILGPMVPLTRFPGISGPDRYMFLLWFCLCLCLALLLMHTVSTLPVRRAGRTLISMTLAMITILPSASTGKNISESRKKGSLSFDIQGRFIYTSTERVAFIPSQEILGSYWFFTSLCELKKREQTSCPKPVIKGVPTQKPVNHLYKFNPQLGMMEDMTPSLGEEIRSNASIDTVRPLSVQFSIENGRIHWQLGPYEKGMYYIASEDLGRYPLPPKGTLRTSISGQSFYIQYESPEGWLISSPRLHLQAGKPLQWERMTTPQ